MIKLYYHGGSENHGCEAIVRATVKILKSEKNTVLYSTNSDEDIRYGLKEICEIAQDSYVTVKRNSFKYIRLAVASKLQKNEYPFIRYGHKKFFDSISSKDICLSIGGDNYCYRGVENLGFYHKAIKKQNGKTVLWGCSVEPDVINENTISDLSSYDMITARETISYEALKKINPNTYLFPDPAFQLDVVEKSLPNGFAENNTVGINVSPLIMEYESGKGMTIKNYINLIEYIIKNTDMQIALIPHVVKDKNDDRESLGKLYDLFKDSGRVIMIEDCNCMELKGYIKRCRFIITARTHASIAAYSTCVPTLVVGYSVKAKGIAKDIFGAYENYVLPVQNLENEMSLTENFKWIADNEQKIKSHLQKVMPEYCSNALVAGKRIKELLG